MTEAQHYIELTHENSLSRDMLLNFPKNGIKKLINSEIRRFEEDEIQSKFDK